MLENYNAIKGIFTTQSVDGDQIASKLFQVPLANRDQVEELYPLAACKAKGVQPDELLTLN